METSLPRPHSSRTGVLRQLGPGLLFAATAVGVSHLVQATRAGADFGLTMALVILVVCAVKYPAFRFGAEYAASSGESVIVAYERQGRWLLVFFLIAIAVEGLAVIPAVSLVTAGMTINLLGLAADEVVVTVAIIAVSSVALAFGRYRFLERISKTFVVVFGVLTIVAASAAAGLLGDGRPLAAPLSPTRENLFFSVAVAGWMPVGMGAAVIISLWIRARSELLGRPIATAEARFDFNVGYAASVVLALGFLLMGTALLFGRGVEVAAGSAGFAAQLVALFADAIGSWISPIVGIAALVVMFSTVLTVVDGFPRVYANVAERLVGAGTLTEQRWYFVFMVVQGIVAVVLLGFFLSSFAVFIDFATTAGFVSAPVIAYLNHRVMTSDAVRYEDRPPRWLAVWSTISVATLTAASITYLAFRFV
jgi:Mn2+/Fe2+ NRAMP family transporter